MTPALRAAVEAALGGAHVLHAVPVSGGDINDAHAVSLADGRTVFVKSNDGADPAMFPAEARGLAFLAEPGLLRVPRVLAVSAGVAGAPSFLVLEYLESAPRAPGFDEALGRGLASLHRAGEQTFGLGCDNFIGRLPQSNRAHRTWPGFYREERLAPQLRRASDSGLATPRMKSSMERLLARLDDLVGPSEAPARLHGDLWGGNLHVDDSGKPCLIDPACYNGHREVDLAMMRLFGGFSAGTFAAYEEVFPLSPGHQERVPLYQLYPLLVHLNLFGGSYAGAVERALEGCAC
ncbi:MAG TPA: fructosamine kinase family protein [Polyangiaceae bacterium]